MIVATVTPAAIVETVTPAADVAVVHWAPMMKQTKKGYRHSG